VELVLVYNRIIILRKGTEGDLHFFQKIFNQGDGLLMSSCQKGQH